MRLLAIAGLLMLGGCQAKEPPPKPEPAVERYKIVYGPVAGWQTMLIDTQTGKTWALVGLGGPNETGNMVFVNVPHQDKLEPWQLDWQKPKAAPK